MNQSKSTMYTNTLHFSCMEIDNIYFIPKKNRSRGNNTFLMSLSCFLDRVDDDVLILTNSGKRQESGTAGGDICESVAVCIPCYCIYSCKTLTSFLRHVFWAHNANKRDNVSMRQVLLWSVLLWFYCYFFLSQIQMVGLVFSNIHVWTYIRISIYSIIGCVRRERKKGQLPKSELCWNDSIYSFHSLFISLTLSS